MLGLIILGLITAGIMKWVTSGDGGNSRSRGRRSSMTSLSSSTNVLSSHSSLQKHWHKCSVTGRYVYGHGDQRCQCQNQATHGLGHGCLGCEKCKSKDSIFTSINIPKIKPYEPMKPYEPIKIPKTDYSLLFNTPIEDKKKYPWDD